MKIVSWNCQGAFYTKNKFKKINELDADIYIIQEINRPKEETNVEYKKFIKNSIYLECPTGKEPSQGYIKAMAIIAKENIKLENNNWEFNDSNDFLSVRVNDFFNLIGVWTHGNYHANLERYLEKHEENFRKTDKLMMVGDFNIDLSIKGYENRDSFVKLLNSYGYCSIYHKLNEMKVTDKEQFTLKMKNMK